MIAAIYFKNKENKQIKILITVIETQLAMNRSVQIYDIVSEGKAFVSDNNIVTEDKNLCH